MGAFCSMEFFFSIFSEKEVSFVLFNILIYWVFLVKPMLVWLVSTKPYLLILLLALTWAKGEVGLMLLPIDKNSINR